MIFQLYTIFLHVVLPVNVTTSSCKFEPQFSEAAICQRNVAAHPLFLFKIPRVHAVINVSASAC